MYVISAAVPDATVRQELNYVLMGHCDFREVIRFRGWPYNIVKQDF